MPDISNPGRGKQVADFRTGRDGGGYALEYSRNTRTVTLAGTVAAGDVLTYVTPTLTVGIRAGKIPLVGTDAQCALYFAGVALQPGVAGEDIQVCVGGICMVNVDATAVAYALGDVVVAPTTTVGRAGRVAKASWSATNIAGTGVGVFLGIGTATEAQVNITNL